MRKEKLTGSTLSWAPTVWEIRSQTSSTALKPASPTRLRMSVGESEGSGTRPGGAGWEAFERPAKNLIWGPPLQFAAPTAPANWMLSRELSVTNRALIKCRVALQVAE